MMMMVLLMWQEQKCLASDLARLQNRGLRWGRVVQICPTPRLVCRHPGHLFFFGGATLVDSRQGRSKLPPQAAKNTERRLHGHFEDDLPVGHVNEGVLGNLAGGIGIGGTPTYINESARVGRERKTTLLGPGPLF